jgi:hypothetical protein
MEKPIKKRAKKARSKRKPIFWRNIMYEVIYRLADTPLPEIIFISSFVLSRWWLNSDFSYPSEIWLPIILFSILASIAFYGYRAIFGKGSAAHLAALLVSYGFYSYSFVHDSWAGKHTVKIIPSHFRTDFAQAVLLGLLMIVLAGLASFVVRKLINHFTILRNLQAYKVLLFAVVFIFGIQAVRYVDRYLQIRNELSYHYPAPSVAKSSAASGKKPDVYYLLFDRYGNPGQLKANFNFDNSDIENFLTDKGFVNRPDAFANYPFTMSSVSSTMAMNYFPQFKSMFSKDSDWQSAFPYRSVLNDPPVAQIFKQNGYQYNLLSSWWDFTRVNIKADSNPDISFRLNVFGAHFYLTDIQRDMFNKSILSPLLKKGISSGKTPILKYDLDRNPRENFEAQMSSLRDIAGRSDKSAPQFSFAHILAPHPPYLFNKDGSWPSYDGEANDNGVDESVKYVNEATYVNSQIKSLVNGIQGKDPGAVIVIQADEGPYPKQFRGDLTPTHYYDPLGLPLDKLQQKFGVMASYYMPGVDPSQVKQIDASVDAFRFVLNNYLGYQMPMLPDCNFSSGDKFKIYNYTLVTDKIKGHAAPTSCQQYQ